MNLLHTPIALVVLAATGLGGSAQDAVRIPSIEASQLARLEMAVAQSRGYDDAFASLVEHLEAWPTPENIDLDGEPVFRKVDWQAIGNAPSEFGGELLLLEGALAMRTPLELSYTSLAMEEWFIRSGQDTVIAYVSAADGTWNPGERVRVVGRFYTTISAESRDGVNRSWPAIVGVPLVASASGGGSAPLVLAAAVILGAAFFLLLRRAQKGPGPAGTAQALAALRRDADEEEVEAELPDDPAEALGVLRHDSCSGKNQDA